MKQRKYPPKALSRHAEDAVARLDVVLNDARRPGWLEFKLHVKRRLDRVPVDQVAGEAEAVLRSLQGPHSVHQHPPAA